MTGLERRWACEVLEAVFPEDLTAAAKDVNVDRFVATFIPALPAKTRLALRGALVLFQFLPLLFIGRIALLRNLRGDDRQRYLDAWYKSRFYLIRQMALLVKLASSLAYLGDEGVQTSLRWRTREAWSPLAGGNESPPPHMPRPSGPIRK